LVGSPLSLSHALSFQIDRGDVMNALQSLTRLLFLVVALLMGFVLIGCDNKETLLEVETPRSEVEVERDRDTGEITVDVDR